MIEIRFLVVYRGKKGKFLGQHWTDWETTEPRPKFEDGRTGYYLGPNSEILDVETRIAPGTQGTAERPGWQSYWLAVAKDVAARADCSRRKVGAVIVDQHQRIVSTGYNGAPPKQGSCLGGDCPRAASGVAPGSSYDTGPGTCIALHAEQNAIVFGDVERMRGGTIFITEPPCDGCARLIRGVGLEAVWE